MPGVNVLKGLQLTPMKQLQKSSSAADGESLCLATLGHVSKVRTILRSDGSRQLRVRPLTTKWHSTQPQFTTLDNEHVEILTVTPHTLRMPLLQCYTHVYFTCSFILHSVLRRVHLLFHRVRSRDSSFCFQYLVFSLSSSSCFVLLIVFPSLPSFLQ